MGRDYGVEINARIKHAKARVVELYNALQLAERDLEDLEQERTEARTECKSCNDCSMCIP